MKWIHSLKEINQFLDENEEIIWSRRENVNINPAGISPFVCFIVFISLGIIYLIYLKSLVGVLLILFIGIASVALVIVIAVKKLKERKETTQLNSKQLKEYEVFYILTNKRYIRKDYIFNFERDLSKFPKDVLEQIGDIIFLNFDVISAFVVSYVMNEINIKIKNFPESRDFFLRFQERDEMENVMELIQTVVPLEMTEKKMGGIKKDIDLYTKYTRK